MVKNFEKSKIAILAVGLVCALAFLINHLATGATTTTTAARDDKDNFAGSRQVKEIKGYKSWAKVNPVPEVMPERVATACAVQLPPAVMLANDARSPHRDKYFTVFVNDVGRQAMLNQKNPKFPEGSVIVKEKLAAKDSQSPELLTVMIKRKKGFNPVSGDWEYMVVNGAGEKVEGRGKLQNCQSCHLATQQNDYIFRTYLVSEVASKLK
jgi:hypothetical protein